MAKRGRPTRAEASAKALRALSNDDLASLDPLQILRSIMADRSAPAAARVTAARALLAHAGGGLKKKQDGDADGAEHDRISERALTLLKGGRR